MYLLWAGRLGSFLFQVGLSSIENRTNTDDLSVQRVLKTGKDGRFDDVKGKPAAFSGFW